MSDKYEGLREAIKIVTPQNFDSAERKFDCDDSYVECPCCGGEGTVDLVADYINYDNCAIGVQFYGIGDLSIYDRETLEKADLAIEAIKRQEGELWVTG